MTLSVDSLISEWVLRTWNAPGVKIHQDRTGCKVSAVNVRFGTAYDGYCETCYHEYPAVIFDTTCTCPPQVTGIKNPSKMRKNPDTFNLKDLDIHAPGNGFQLHDILGELQEIEREHDGKETS